MHVQPYFPQPLSVAGNVADERHRVCVRFIKKVTWLHLLTVGIAMLGHYLLPLTLNLSQALFWFLGCLVALSITRRALRRSWMEQVSSVLLYLPTAWSASQISQHLVAQGWPMWVVPLGACLAALYCLFCGWDHSFLGMFFIAFVVGVLGIIAASLYTGFAFWPAIAILAGYLFYLCYDLAMILRRRRLGEAISASVDIYRDLINALTYPFRVALHWRRFQFF